MIKKLIGLKVASSMFAIGIAAGMGIIVLCKYTKVETRGKSETKNPMD